MSEWIADSLDVAATSFSEKIAFADEKEALTFAALRAQSFAVASFFYDFGLRKEAVAICMEKTPFTVAAMFGALCAGCFYTVVEADTPKERLVRILRQLDTRVVLCDDATKATVTDAANKLRIDVFDYRDATAREIDEAALLCAKEDAKDDDLAYVSFTSGSTGTPKGVAVTHKNLRAYVERLCDAMGFSEDTIFANQTPFSTDASLKEIFPTVMKGATTWIAPKLYFSFPVKLISFLNEHRVNTICWAASAFSIVVAMDALQVDAPRYLKTVAFTSEPMPANTLRAWMTTVKDARFTNLYGPTEATGVCCCYHVSSPPEGDARIPVGYPFPDAKLSIVDGEIIVGGPQVASGYYRDDKRTKEVFFANEAGERFYKTGDLGSFDENGALYVTGRRDFQIKRMGYRIELEEIEAVALNVTGVLHAGACFDADEDQIALFYEGAAEEVSVRSRLKEALPRYMQPNTVKKVARLPLTANGKIDRAQCQKFFVSKEFS